MLVLETVRKRLSSTASLLSANLADGYDASGQTVGAHQRV